MRNICKGPCILAARSKLMMKRAFDSIFALVLLIVFCIPVLVLALLVKLEDGGPSFHWSKRVGLQGALFEMPKLRSMSVDTPQLATDLMTDPGRHLTQVGQFLRKTSLDELPQIYSVLVGKMSFVGPRPALFNQYELIQARQDLGINALLPGITGLAQINGRDNISEQKKIEYDLMYLHKHSFLFDIQILATTIFQVLARKSIAH